MDCCTSPSPSQSTLPVCAPVPSLALAPDPRRAVITWSDLVALESALVEVEHLARSLHRSDTTTHPDWRDWERVKRQMSALVGWSASNPAVRTEASYDIAHRHLLDCWELGASEVTG
jgi:hypothetical protein